MVGKYCGKVWWGIMVEKYGGELDRERRKMKKKMQIYFGAFLVKKFSVYHIQGF